MLFQNYLLLKLRENTRVVAVGNKVVILKLLSRPPRPTLRRLPRSIDCFLREPIPCFPGSCGRNFDNDSLLYWGVHEKEGTNDHDASDVFRSRCAAKLETSEERIGRRTGNVQARCLVVLSGAKSGTNLLATPLLDPSHVETFVVGFWPHILDGFKASEVRHIGFPT